MSENNDENFWLAEIMTAAGAMTILNVEATDEHAARKRLEELHPGSVVIRIIPFEDGKASFILR